MKEVHVSHMHGPVREQAPFLRATVELLGRARRNRSVVVGSIIVFSLIAVALFAPWLAPHNPATQHDDGLEFGLPLPPLQNSEYVLGTDGLGRDVLSRLLHGARVSLVTGVGSMLLAAVVGTTLGLLSGYYGGTTDMVIMRFTDVIMAFPAFLFTMATMGSLKPGLFSLFVSIAIVRWAGMARMVRGQTLTLKEQEFVEGAKAIGVGNRAIVWKHVFPNALAPILVTVTMGIAGAILTESSLSFLGLGIQPPTPSWGMMVNEGRNYMFMRPSLVFLPSAAIALAVIGFNLLGDGLRDILDPRIRGSS